ncbi:Putative glycogen debranching enzyme [Minicystis rosea]|nr:Putative glycogen debranching enzyme [Minicystis rosea]
MNGDGGPSSASTLTAVTPRSDRPASDDAGASGAAASPWPSVRVQRDLGRARREWLHTNGAGAYGSSTLAGLHTRRYHGLLVAALDPPRGRHVMISHMDTTVLGPRGAAGASMRYGGRPAWELAKHQFPGVDPRATPFHLERFDQDPLPRFTYDIGGGELEITLALVRGENALVMRYAYAGKLPLDLRVRPLIAARHFHKLTREHGGMLQRVELRPTEGGAATSTSGAPPGEMRVQPRRELPRICFRYEGTFVGSPDWWRRFEYLAERDRGLDYEEDLWTPGVFEMPLRDGAPVWLVAGVERLPEGEPAALMEAARHALLAEDPGPGVPLVQRRLTVAAEVFRADLARRPGVIAGYPWFEVWGRAALAALPGLYLVPGRRDGALRVLRELTAAMQDGLVPNRMPEPAFVPNSAHGAGNGAPDHASADATLWLFEAARHVADTLGDGHPFVTDELLLALHDAFEAILRGTRHGIHLSADGLFVAGRPGDALTWMDARVAGTPVTSRAGCAVELSALWARGCDTLARLAHAAGDTVLATRALAERDRTRAAFHARFWCEETGYPYDTIAEPQGDEVAFHDASVRPNAVIALAVDPACFTADRARRLLDRARRELVTPAGLRTLAPSDARYLGRYGGDVKARDGACHQGSVWPWLLGFYARAALRAGVEDTASIEHLVTSAAHTEIALGHTAELSDGDAPHFPGGCFAHACSVAELLRVLAWDLPRAAP